MYSISSCIPKKLRPFVSNILIACVVLACCICYGSFHDSTSNTTVETARDSNALSTNTEFEHYTSQFFADEIVSSTLNLHYMVEDYHSYDIIDPPITFGEFTSDSAALSLSIENHMQRLSTFSFDKLSPENQLTYDILLHYLTYAEEGTAYTLFAEPLTPYTGLHTQLPILLAEYALRSREDVSTYLNLLTMLPPYFDSLLAFEEEKANAGLFMSDTQLDTVLEDCNAFILMEQNYLISTFDTRIASIAELTQEERLDFSSKNKSCIQDTVIPTYQTLINGLESLRNTGTNGQGLCYYENGRNYYAHLLRTNVGTSRTIPEVKTLIENQILDDLLDLQEANSTLSSTTLISPEIPGTPEEVLLNLENHLTNLFPPTSEVHVTVHDVPTELEPFLSPAFYLIPPIDNVSENAIYINNAHMTDDVTRYTTLAHEGYPGHLYQTTYFASTYPDPIRSLFSYGGYSEGWATYAEMCSYYITDIPGPTDTILQKSASLQLGLYAFVDIGIHYEGWALTDTLDFFKTYGISDSATIMKIYNLIVATPTNYLKYYVGYLEFLELKKQCIDSWGNDFSQIRFHKAVLEVGPVPFDILSEYVLEK